VLSIEGLAIVSNNGMLAASNGLMPNSLKFEADQKFYSDSLDAATLLVHGRMSHEQQPNSPHRRRLLLSRSAGPFSREPVSPNVWMWNPALTPFADVCATLGITSGIVAVLGGTSVYDMFLPDYTKFELCRAGLVSLPGGVPLFSGGRAPEDVLSAAGLKLANEVVIDAEQELRHQTWVR
jgi:hypothetical protein